MNEVTASNWSPLHIISATLGVVAIVLSIFISGYAAMAAGIIGGVLGLLTPGRGRAIAVVLCAIGFVLGAGTIAMKMAVDA